MTERIIVLMLYIAQKKDDAKRLLTGYCNFSLKENMI
jgi:hypothetical protein